MNRIDVPFYVNFCIKDLIDFKTSFYSYIDYKYKMRSMNSFYFLEHIYLEI
jgi:hypothetical protein